MAFTYTSGRRLSAEEFIGVLKRSGLAERRPINDPAAIAAMLRHANLTWTAWDGANLIGVARSVTDFEYCCYLSDLAVDESYQKHGVGRRLIEKTQQSLGPKAKVILLAAPNAASYYPRLGFEQHPSAWTVSSRQPLK
jgi:GNAT superfamily N-acetyltransferase